MVQTGELEGKTGNLIYKTKHQVFCHLEDYRFVLIAQNIKLELQLLSCLRKSPVEQLFKQEN